MITIRLETSRLLLRPFTRSDVEALHRLWTDPLVRKYLWDDQIIPRETAVEASLESFRQHGFGFWCVSFRERGALIGFCGLRHRTTRDKPPRQRSTLRKFGLKKNWTLC